MVSKKGGIKGIVLVFLLSFLAGGGFFFFDEFDLFSLREYVLEAPDSEIEQRFWNLIPPECIRFWPLFVLRFPQLQLLMERTIPVTVVNEITGNGSFCTKIDFIEPWIRIGWKGSNWYLSESGMMWKPSIWGLKSPGGPLWKLPDTFGSHNYSGMIENVPDGVFPAMFSVDLLREFVEIFDDKPWFKSVKEVEITRRAGEYILKLTVDAGRRSVFLSAQGDSQKWNDIEFLLKRIVPSAVRQSEDLTLDMTYSNKIVVRRDVHEGSSK